MSDGETSSPPGNGSDGGNSSPSRNTEGSRPTRVAIACQGGGSHSAFTAGVLRQLLREWDGDRYELVGLSGTSGGAFNALAAWYGLVTADEARAVDLLGDLWDDLAATDPADRLMNDWLVGANRIESTGVPVPRVSPYLLPGGNRAKAEIEGVLTRHIDFEAIPDLCARTVPELVVGTVNVNAGTFETFVNEAVTPRAVLASAAVPTLFEGVEFDGHVHWDGLFSQNPPVDDLMHVDAGRKPDELWIVQINPQEFEGTPQTLDVIADRRNELAGNISLNQELRFIEQVNEWIDEGYLPAEEFSHTEIRAIEMGQRYHCSTKLDRSESFIEELVELGESRAGEFLTELDSPDT